MGEFDDLKTTGIGDKFTTALPHCDVCDWKPAVGDEVEFRQCSECEEVIACICSSCGLRLSMDSRCCHKRAVNE